MIGRLRRLSFDERTTVLVVRAGVLVLCAALNLFERDGISGVARLGALAAVAGIASLPMPWEPVRRAIPPLEAVAAAVIALSGHGPHEAFLPYLLVPAVSAGVFFGFTGPVLATGAALVALFTARAAGLSNQNIFVVVARGLEWALLGLAAGLVAAWAKRLLARPMPAVNASYEAAYRLLSQLRTVSRQLSGGLDAVGLAQSLLQALDRVLPYDRGAVFVRTGGGRLVPLAFEGAERVDWDTSLSGDSLFAEAWSAQQPTVRSTSFSPADSGTSVALPLRVGLRTFGVVGLERSDPSPVPAESLAAAADLTDDFTMRLDTALLFEEVRSIATAEERRRVAREIHDGIAQELASLGYVVDDLAFHSRGHDLEKPLRSLRREITRIVSELRLSIFDLRSDVQSSGGLGAALSDYVRSVGTSSGLTVHLLLDESPRRLPAETEAELLRIGQESITNARKHARAENLWVSCRVDPPQAELRVEDDGEGLGRARHDSFGMQVMRERAERIGAALRIDNRPGGGTVVQVVLGAADAAGGGRREENRADDRAARR